MPPEAALLVLLGLLAWSLTEYLMHRFVAHWHDRFCEHHADPEDYSAGPTWSQNLAGLALVCAVAPFPFSIGFLLGYALYAWLHFNMHHDAAHCPRVLLRNHNVHHWRDDHANYGVTSPLWDVVFGTYRGSK